ncbi:hypothetical protein Tco_1147238 [Tanacetum coccineum]
MDTTRADQKALYDELVAPENRLKIGKSNLRLSFNLKSKEPTLQVALDAIKLTPFYNAFEITADVPEIYMQEFWVTVSRHHSSLCFKLNGKSHTVNVYKFRDMLKICPKLQGQKFKEPPLEEEILSFITDLRHTGEIKFLSDINVNHMHQPWRSFSTIINKCLSGKTTALESLLIVDYFMAKDQAIPKRNMMFWHYARDDFMFTTVRVISKHQDTQVYDVILPQHLTNQAMLESEAYMTYRAYATGDMTPKPKSTKKKADSESSPKTNPTQASKRKRIKTSAKGDKAAKMKQSTTKSKGLTVLSEVALSKADQMKLATKRSKKEFHSSHASGSGDGVDIQSKVPDDQGEDDEENDKHDSEDDNDKHDSKNDNDDEYDDQDNVSGEPESDDDEDDFVHPNLSTYKADDQEEEKEFKKANDDIEVFSDQKVSTPPDYELTKEEENKEDDDNTEEVYVTLTIEPPVVQQQSSSVSSDLVSKFINPSSDTFIDSILNPNVQSDIPVNVLVSATTETPSSDTKIPQPPILIIQSQQQTHDSTTTTTTIPTTTLLEIPNFASLFALSSIMGIVDNYLASQMKDVVNVAVQLQSNKLREDAQVKNDEFLKQIDSNIKAIIKDQVKAQVSKIMPKVEKYVTESLGAEVLARSSNQPYTSYAAVASLSEFELKKILIDKIKENKLMNISDIQKNLYNTLIESYNSDKDLFASYGDIKPRDEAKEIRQGRVIKKATQKESKSTSSSKGASRSQPKSSGKSAQAEEHGPRVDDLEEPLHQEFTTGNDDVSPVKEIMAIDERPWNPSGSQTLDSEWNKIKTWIRYHVEKYSKLQNDQLDWHNPEGRPYPHDLSKPLPLIQNARGRKVIPFDHFINNDLEYLKGGSLSQKYTTSFTKTNAADYGHVKWIEDKAPKSIWSPAQVVYDKHACWGTYQWGTKL